MKLLLLLVISCLALHNGKGAPRNAVYKFVRCNPEGDQANCVTHQSPVMAWSQDLPAKLPASTAQYLEAEPVEDERPPRDEDEEEQMEEEEMPILGEEGEYVPEESSGFYEGSAFEGPFIADGGFVATESDAGSGESWTERDVDLNKGVNTRAMRRLLFGRYGGAKPAEQELRDDDLLQL